MVFLLWVGHAVSQNCNPVFKYVEVIVKFEGAVIKEQGITFAIVIVKKYILDQKSEADKAIRSFQTFFPGIPLVLMAQDYKGTPTYYGRRDIARFLADVSIHTIPWKEYTVG